MSNRRKIASIAFAGAAAAAATMMGAAPALAAASWQVTNGGVLYKGPVKGKLRAGTVAVLKDTTKNTTLTCKTAIFSGTITKSKSPLPPPPKQLGFVKKTVTKWSSCTGPDGLMFKAHLTTSPKWIASAFSAVHDVTFGKLSGNKISGVISGTGQFNTCKATISGLTVTANYFNNLRSFGINSGQRSTLNVKAVTGFCANAINVKDKAYFSGIYHVSSPTRLSIS